MILPVYAVARADPELVHRGLRRPRRAQAGRRCGGVILPLALPGVVAGSIFTFSLTLGDYITPILVGNTPVHRQRRLPQRLGLTQQPALRRRLRDGAARRDGASTWSSRGAPAPSRRSDGALARAASASRVWTLLVVAVPLDPASRSSCVYAFNPSNIQSWPIPGLTLKWFRDRLGGRGRPRRAAAVAEGGALRHGHRARPGDDGRRGRLALPLLRPRGALVHARASDRAAGRRHGHRARVVLQLLGRPVLAVDDRDRARHLLRRRRLQQRGGPAPAHVARRWSRRRWTSARTAGRRSAA